MASNSNDIITGTQINKINKEFKANLAKNTPWHLAGYVANLTTDIIETPKGYEIIFRFPTNLMPRFGDARAQEYGSGIHASSNYVSKFQLGAKKKIIIKPKNKRVLAFYWQKANIQNLKRGIYRYHHNKTGDETTLPKFAGGPTKTDKRLMFNWVEHPGIVAANQGKGYIGLSFHQSTDVIMAGVKEDSKIKLHRLFGRVRSAAEARQLLKGTKFLTDLTRIR